MAVHLSSSGFGLRQLCDLSMMVEIKGNEINWNEVSKKIDEYGITRFAAALFIICRRLFNTQIPVVIKDHCLYDNIIENFIEDIFTGGIFGQRILARELCGIQLHYISNVGQEGTTKQLRNIISIIFPSIQMMGNQYTYAKNHPILTPIAWIHRIFYGFFRKDFTLSEKRSLIIPDKSIALDIKNHAKLLHSLDLK
jgi:Golgi nucleoside diphosphatase